MSEALASADASQIPAQHVKRLRKTISEASEKLRKVTEKLDPIKHPGFVFDPASKTAIEQGDRLASRLLNDHRRNILKATTTLRLDDFDYRVLVVQTGWQASAEDFLIHLFKPIWNNEIGICYGFGKHGDRPETRVNLR